MIAKFVVLGSGNQKLTFNVQTHFVLFFGKSLVLYEKWLFNSKSVLHLIFLYQLPQTVTPLSTRLRTDQIIYGGQERQSFLTLKTNFLNVCAPSSLLSTFRKWHLKRVWYGQQLQHKQSRLFCQLYVQVPQIQLVRSRNLDIKIQT